MSKPKFDLSKLIGVDSPIKKIEDKIVKPSTPVNVPDFKPGKYAEMPRMPKNEKASKERDTYLAIGALIGAGVGFVIDQITFGTPLGAMIVPMGLPAIAGAGAGIMYVISKGDMIKTMFMAKTFPGNYKYGFGMSVDGNGVTTISPLKKHNAKDHYFINGKSHKPIILDRNKAELGNPLITIDKVPFVQYSATDSVPAYPDEGAAAVQFYEAARALVDREVPLYNQDGTPSLDPQGRQRTETRQSPKYPEIYKIPIENMRYISDMCFESENREQLFAYAMNSVVMEKQYNVPDTEELELVDEKSGQTLLGPDGQPIVKTQNKIDADGRPVYRRATPEEVEMLRFQKAEELTEEVIALRQECAVTEAKSGISVLNRLYPFVVRPWMQGEMDNIRMQSIQQAYDEAKDQERQAKRVDNTTVLMIGAAVAVGILVVVLKVAGKI